MQLGALALLACAATAAASAGSVFMASTPGTSLARRGTDGYLPKLTKCDKDGDSCAAVCGAGYDRCASSKPNETHCFNPTVGESCCMDGSGSMSCPGPFPSSPPCPLADFRAPPDSCVEGFFCTNSLDKKNWCCPDNMSLEQCATKYGVTNGLQLAKPSSTSTPPVPSSTSSVIPTSTPSPPTTTTTTTTSARPIVKAQANSTTSSTSTTHELVVCSTSVVGAPVNSTIANVGPTQPLGSVPHVPSLVPPPSNITISGGAASGVSSLLIVLAGFVAVM
ncbi:hypothetical protein OCS_02658 [Ophiocordyceps sinensis CO18]|uniref:Prp 4 CRoW domain-containing protein n=1 Tax=Ophiocordyceps sinensis (strain Co18 / CGMCC 3.14243) TaxID=911162 RepID=T5A857_OPHSC|nr:hypothetical protein OCS_02658 [Ophiocordyceps sinensis CO18]